MPTPFYVHEKEAHPRKNANKPFCSVLTFPTSSSKSKMGLLLKISNHFASIADGFSTTLIQIFKSAFLTFVLVRSLTCIILEVLRGFVFSLLCINQSFKIFRGTSSSVAAFPGMTYPNYSPHKFGAFHSTTIDSSA